MSFCPCHIVISTGSPGLLPNRPAAPAAARQRRAAGDEPRPGSSLRILRALGEDDRPGQVARPVRVEPRGLGEGDRRALGEDERGERVEVVATAVAPAARTLSRTPSAGAPNDQTTRPGAGDADRPVAVLEDRVGLGPRLRRLAQLERGLVREADGPAAAEERPLVGGRPARPAAGASSARSASARRRLDVDAGSCARSSVSAVVAKRVCTTDCSSAKSSTTASSAASATGVPATAVIATRARRPSGVPSACDDLGRRARARHRDDDVVGAAARAARRRRRRPSGRGRTPRAGRVRLRHEQRGAAADHRRRRPGCGQRRRAARRPPAATAAAGSRSRRP